MKIKLNTISEMPIAIDSYGDKVSILLNLDRHPRDQPFALIEKALFGGKGEIFTQDRFIKFKSNGGFSKLKKQETVNYSDITELETFNGSTGLTWKLSGATGEFETSLMFYGKVKGLNPWDIFWYDIDEFPVRSGAFYALLSEVLPRTGLASDLKPSTVKRKLEEAIDIFEGNRNVEDLGLKLNLADAGYPRFTVMQRAVADFLAGTAIATESTRDSYLKIFRNLDNIFIRILKKLMPEFNAGMGNLFNREQKISNADEKFKRLSSRWYLRQIANLHFASKYLSKDEIRIWSTKIVRPRAMAHNAGKVRTLSIKLPELKVFEEAIASLENNG